MLYSEIVRLITDSNVSNDWAGVSNGSLSIRYLLNDVNIRIECSHEGQDIQNENFQEPWANKHPNPRAVGYFYNLYYSSTLLRRIILVSVDGGRSNLPIPRANTSLVDPFDYKIAEIFDITNSLQQYMQRSGLSL